MGFLKKSNQKQKQAEQQFNQERQEDLKKCTAEIKAICDKYGFDMRPVINEFGPMLKFFDKPKQSNIETPVVTPMV